MFEQRERRHSNQIQRKIFTRYVEVDKHFFAPGTMYVYTNVFKMYHALRSTRSAFKPQIFYCVFRSNFVDFPDEQQTLDRGRYLIDPKKYIHFGRLLFPLSPTQIALT